MSKLATLSYGQRYSDNSGWQWRVSYIAGDAFPVRIEGGSGELMFRANEIDFREVADALSRIADAIDSSLP